MKKLLRTPSGRQLKDKPGKFERFKLIENPFPSEPVVNKDSEDKRINGNIYEIEIRRKEHDQVIEWFIKPTQSDPNHLRLGYIIDTSYIGRGNGKSAFLINLLHDINRGYCLDLSSDLNKCFGVYVAPEPGGRTKTFPIFLDLLFNSIIASNVIKSSLATLRLEAIRDQNPTCFSKIEVLDDEDIADKLNDSEWLKELGVDVDGISDIIYKNEYMQDVSPDFPLLAGRNTFFRPFITQDSFTEYYKNNLKKGNEKLTFVFTELVRLFQAAHFNGAFVLVDDFERIPDFQSARQKRDFALELRSCLFDGLYLNARIGFYNFLLVLHAGVPRLISDAWAESGMDNRAPISPQVASKHVIPFEKLSKDHASLLLRKYLSEYRINGSAINPLFPFTEDAVAKIGELSEYNAAKILKIAYDLLDKASDIPEQVQIDEKFVAENKGIGDPSGKNVPSIEDAESTDLLKKAESKE
ncbi:MAG: hypothetical protein WCJ37_04670 [Syntrophus sp. (in: bacteria)]